MRFVLLFLLLGCALALAALWQEKTLAAMRTERENAFRVATGEASTTPVGELEAGVGVVLVGSISGAEAIPIPRPALPQATQETAPSARQPLRGRSRSGLLPVPDSLTRSGGAAAGGESVTEDPSERSLPDFEYTVPEGQTLSEIAQAHYGTAAPSLVRALALYNDVDPDRVFAGMQLKLPDRDLLERSGEGE